MLFLKLTPTEEKSHSYMCAQLQQTIDKMKNARITIEEVANNSLDKSYAKCLYLLSCESLQCEAEIRSQISMLSHAQLGFEPGESTSLPKRFRNIKSMDSLCIYLENNYIKPYLKLLKDKYLSVSLKDLIKHQLQLFLSSITQLKLLNDVRPSLN